MIISPLFIIKYVVSLGYMIILRFIDNGEWMNCFCDNKDIKLI